MGVRVVYKGVDFSANKLPAEFQEVSPEVVWEGWLCNYNSSNEAQQNQSWSTRIFKIPEGVDKVYISGKVDEYPSFGISLISDYNNSTHAYTNVAKNILVNAGTVNRREIDLSDYSGAKYVMWCYINTAPTEHKVEVYR